MLEILALPGLNSEELHSILKNCLNTIAYLGNGNPYKGFSLLLDQESKFIKNSKAIWGANLNIGDVSSGDVIITLTENDPNNLEPFIVLDVDNTNESRKILITNGKVCSSLSTKDIIILLPKKHAIVEQSSFLQGFNVNLKGEH